MPSSVQTGSIQAPVILSATKLCCTTLMDCFINCLFILYFISCSSVNIIFVKKKERKNKT